MPYLLAPTVPLRLALNAMTKIRDEDVKRITDLFTELVGLMTNLGLINVGKPKPVYKGNPLLKKQEVGFSVKSSSSGNTKAQEVLDYYKKIHPKKARGVKPGHSDFEIIKKRLKVFSTEELKKAIDSNLQCDWHQGVRGGHSLKMVFRNDHKVEGFLEAKPTKQGNPGIGHHSGDEEHSDGPQEFKAE